jgi:hypothetical protein
MPMRRLGGPEGATYAPSLFRQIGLPFSPAKTPQLITEVLQVTSDALEWYDAVGRAEGLAQVTADRDALPYAEPWRTGHHHGAEELAGI